MADSVSTDVLPLFLHAAVLCSVMLLLLCLGWKTVMPVPPLLMLGRSWWSQSNLSHLSHDFLDQHNCIFFTLCFHRHVFCRVSPLFNVGEGLTFCCFPEGGGKLRKSCQHHRWRKPQMGCWWEESESGFNTELLGLLPSRVHRVDTQDRNSHHSYDVAGGDDRKIMISMNCS